MRNGGFKFEVQLMQNRERMQALNVDPPEGSYFIVDPRIRSLPLAGYPLRVPD